MSDASQSQSVEIEASVEACIEVLVDFPRYPSWSSPIEVCRVLETDPSGRARIVEFVLDMKIRKVRYVLEYAYQLDDRPASANWHLVEGDVAGIEGNYCFEPIDKDRTRA